MSLTVRNGSMASLYALRGQVSWSCWRRDADEGCGHGRGPDGCQPEGVVVGMLSLSCGSVLIQSTGVIRDWNERGKKRKGGQFGMNEEMKRICSFDRKD